jgi:hypothetical protein
MRQLVILRAETYVGMLYLYGYVYDGSAFSFHSRLSALICQVAEGVLICSIHLFVE